MSRESPVLLLVVSKKKNKFSSTSQILNSFLIILSLRCFCKLENYFFIFHSYVVCMLVYLEGWAHTCVAACGSLRLMSGVILIT